MSENGTLITRNVGTAERVISALAGGAMIYAGLTRRNAAGIATAIAGGTLILRGASGHSLLYDALEVTSAGKEAQTVRAKTAVTINKPADELYGEWRGLRHHPRFMYYIESVDVRTEQLSHWKLVGPAGFTLEWDSEVTEERPGEYVAWKSVGESDVEQSGSVRFEKAAGDRGTIVRLEQSFIPPAGRMLTPVNPLLDLITNNQLRADLLRFKQLMETGEIATTDGQPRGAASESEIRSSKLKAASL